MFILVTSKVNYNLLLGREWIYVAGAIPFTFHQPLIFFWNEGYEEHVKAYQSIYKGANTDMLLKSLNTHKSSNINHMKKDMSVHPLL